MIPTNDISILSKVVDTTTEKQIEFSVDIVPTGWLHALLQRWGIRPTVKKFIARPITLGNLIRISKLLLGIDMAIYKKEAILESNYELIQKHAYQVAQIVAIALHNRKDEPPASLTDLVLHNFTSSELMNALQIVLRQMDITNFMTSIISVRGLNVLEKPEVSPIEQGSSIAPGASSGT